MTVDTQTIVGWELIHPLFTLQLSFINYVWYLIQLIDNKLTLIFKQNEITNIK